MHVNLESETFEVLIRCLDILKNSCNDVDIRNGMIRQHITGRSAIVEIALNEIWGNVDIPINDIKQKLSILKTFEKVNLHINERYYSFSDNTSTFKIQKPNLEYMDNDNKFIPLEELQEKYKLLDENIILETEIPEQISDRIKSITNNLKMISLRLNMDLEKASLSVSTQSTEQEFIFMKDIPTTNKDLQCYGNLFVYPFTIDHNGNINMKIYSMGYNRTMNIFSTNINTIPVKIFTLSTLITSQNEDMPF